MCDKKKRRRNRAVSIPSCDGNLKCEKEKKRKREQVKKFMNWEQKRERVVYTRQISVTKMHAGLVKWVSVTETLLFWHGLGVRFPLYAGFAHFFLVLCFLYLVNYALLS